MVKWDFAVDPTDPIDGWDNGYVRIGRFAHRRTGGTSSVEEGRGKNQLDGKLEPAQAQTRVVLIVRNHLRLVDTGKRAEDRVFENAGRTHG